MRVDLELKPTDMCAEEGADYDGCACTGIVYFGTWKSMMLDEEPRYQKIRVKGAVKCSTLIFGDPVPGEKKSCYCKGKKGTRPARKGKRKKVVKTLVEDVTEPERPTPQPTPTPTPAPEPAPTPAGPKEVWQTDGKDGKWGWTWTTCPRENGSKCGRYELKGRYATTVDRNGKAKLRVSGRLNWSGKARDKDEPIGVFIALTTRDRDILEWSANNWDPNSRTWLFYSSFNRCGINNMLTCGKNFRSFSFDETWKRTALNEGSNYLRFATERPFSHRTRYRELKLGESR